MKMKATYIKYITLLIAITSMVSCNGWLDNQPEGKITQDQFWKSESDVDAMVGTCYRSMINNTNISNMLVWGELRADNLTLTQTSPNSELGRFEEANILPTSSLTRWASWYNVINYCNMVLYWAPKVPDPNFTAMELRARESEVLALRALCYFYLVRTFKDVPLVLTPSSSDAQNYQVSQSTENEVLDQIEKDLLEAEGKSLLSYSDIKYNKGRITRYAIWAMLADVYLWRNKYNECVTYCDKLVNLPAFKLIDPEKKPFYTIFGQKNSSESIFELQFESSNNYANSTVTSSFGTSERPQGAFSASTFIGTNENNPVFKTVPVLTDVRKKDYMKPITTDPLKGPWAIFKYAGLQRMESSDGTSSSYFYRDGLNNANWIVYRISDVMLMKAEALAHSDVVDNRKAAIHMVNLNYMRSNPLLLPTDTLVLDDYNSTEALEELVLLERQREFMFEGKRWYDLVRLARRDGNTNRLIAKVIRKYTSNASMISSKLKDMNSLYLPINEFEMKANPKLKQNPYYEKTITN